MGFLRGTTIIAGRLYHHTGTMLEFTRAQATFLPATNQAVELVMPDGTVLPAAYTSTAAFPYFHGPQLVRWIKRWLTFGEGQAVTVTEPTRGPLVVSLTAIAPITVAGAKKTRVRRSVKRLGRMRTRTRQTYERWERDPALRDVVLSVWPPTCQVDGCDLAARGAGSLASRVVDVHHLRSVSNRGSDSALNLCVLCVLHHSLVHRAPVSSVEDTDARSATMRVDGLVLDIRRDGPALMRVLGL
jgi:hypothetical protein